MLLSILLLNCRILHKHSGLGHSCPFWRPRRLCKEVGSSSCHMSGRIGRVPWHRRSQPWGLRSDQFPGAWSALAGAGSRDLARGGGRVARAGQACSSCGTLLLKPLIASNTVDPHCVINSHALRNTTPSFTPYHFE